jgi:hypothetical protein
MTTRKYTRESHSSPSFHMCGGVKFLSGNSHKIPPIIPDFHMQMPYTTGEGQRPWDLGSCTDKQVKKEVKNVNMVDVLSIQE